ncbi:MAG: lysine--tRNA ligase [bacterium]
MDKKSGKEKSNQPSSWPFQEAARLNLDKLGPDETVVFQSGFGPSGRPHIGTFAEVARTVMVKNAFQDMHPDRQATLYAFCDDMDGLRKVPGNLPNRKMLKEHIGKPLHQIPDPFETDESYSAHMERELIEFLSRFGFDFELKSSKDEYSSGAFNQGLHLVLENYDKVREVILPTLGEENRQEWSPVIPACRNCGRIYTTVVTGHNAERDTVSYSCTASFGKGDDMVKGCGHHDEVSVLDGNAKVGWKVDWALRWFSYKVRYEMYGKDLIDSARLSGKICRILGGDPPAGMVYEMFLSEQGKKISKSVGEGLSVDEWMTYAPIESLFFYLFPNPKKQRRLYFDVIPKSVDDYLAELKKYPDLDPASQKDSVVWHLSKIGRTVPAYTARINFSLVLNLISAIGAGDRQLLHEYIRRYDPEASDNPAVTDKLVDRAIRYYLDLVEPYKNYREPEEKEKDWFRSILEKLGDYEGDDENDLQAMIFDTAREHGAAPGEVFQAFYQVLLGQDRGPRFGTFVKLVGKDRAMQMISKALS